MTAVDPDGIIVVTAYLSATVALLVLSARATSGINWPTHRRKARTRRRSRKLRLRGRMTQWRPEE